MLPQALYIGSMRCGSTYLREYFNQHPQIFWERKAWAFKLWNNDDKRVGEYRKYFENISVPYNSVLIDFRECIALGYYLVGWATDSVRKSIFDNLCNGNLLIFDPKWGAKLDQPLHEVVRFNHKKIVERIKNTIGDVKIIIGIREQVDWLESMANHYRGHYKTGNLVDFFRTVEGRAALFSAHYDQLVKAYAMHFPTHVFFFDDLVNSPLKVFSLLCKFLDIDFNEPQIKKMDEAKNTFGGNKFRFSRDAEHFIRGVYANSNNNLVNLLNRDLPKGWVL